MALEGTFDDMPLADLIVVFQVGRKTGLLAVENVEARGFVYVSHGRLIDAFVEEWPSQRVTFTGDEAVLDVLAWRTGQFVFSTDISVVRRPVTVFLDCDALIRHSEMRQTGNVTSLTSAGRELHATVDLAELGNDAFSADLGGQQRTTPLPSRHSMWHGRSEATESHPTPLGRVVRPETPIPQPLLHVPPSNHQSVPMQAPPAPQHAHQPASRLLQAVLRRVRSL